jgi:hypothetical protein
MRGQFGGRGGMGGADLGHAFTTGASQELYQMTGRTPGLSSGGGNNEKIKKTAARLDAIEKAEEAAQKARENAFEKVTERITRLILNAQKVKKLKKPRKFTNEELKALIEEMEQ